MNMDNLRKQMNSLAFDESEVVRLKDELASEVCKNAVIVRMLNICISAKKITSSLSQIEEMIDTKKQLLADTEAEVAKATGEAEQEIALQQARVKEKTKEAHDKITKVIKDVKERESEQKRESAERVEKAIHNDNIAIKESGKKVKEARKMELDAIAKTDIALQKKKDLQESLV